MSAPIFLYPTLSKAMKEAGIFQGKKYSFSYTDNLGIEKELNYDIASVDSPINCLKTDGVWSPDKIQTIIWAKRNCM